MAEGMKWVNKKDRLQSEELPPVNSTLNQQSINGLRLGNAFSFTRDEARYKFVTYHYKFIFGFSYLFFWPYVRLGSFSGVQPIGDPSSFRNRLLFFFSWLRFFIVLNINELN
jgi:hypothetical protein